MRKEEMPNGYAYVIETNREWAHAIPSEMKDILKAVAALFDCGRDDSSEDPRFHDRLTHLQEKHNYFLDNWSL